MEESSGGAIDGYDVVTCARCGAGYANGIPRQAELDAYYAAASKYEYHQRGGQESTYDRIRLEATASDLEPHIGTSAARILDIGCATGRLLATLRAHGFTNVQGVDPSPRCVAVAAELYGIDVVQGSVMDLPDSVAAADLVTLVGVLEHIVDLDHALTSVKDVVRAGGQLWVEVPDALGFCDWDNAPFQEFSIEHIMFFSPASLTNLMARHGFEPVHVARNARPQSWRTMMANISGLFRKTDAGREVVSDCDTTTRPALLRYVEQSAEADRRLNARIDAIIDAGRPIVVWGVGTHTRRLLHMSRLADAPIVAFVDSNVKYQGKTLAERPIIAPGDLHGRPEPILISSRPFEREIAEQIRDELKLPNELILLYDV